MIEVTPAMIKAAWVEARLWWPRKIERRGDKFIAVETCITVAEREAKRTRFLADREGASNGL